MVMGCVALGDGIRVFRNRRTSGTCQQSFFRITIDYVDIYAFEFTPALS